MSRRAMVPEPLSANGEEPPKDREQLEPSPYLSIVLPAHNEVDLLGSTVTNLTTGLSARGLTHEILLVENGSRDGTLRLARHLHAQLHQVRVLTLPIGDYGAALAAGFAAARGTIVVNFDVDYYDLNFLDQAVRLIADDGISLVVASKRSIGAHDARPMFRRVLTGGFTKLLQVTLGLELSDAHGMKAMERAAVAEIAEHCSMRGSLFDVELVLRTMNAGLPTREIPAFVVERRPPRTSLAKRTVESLTGVARLRIHLESERRRLPR